MGNLEFNMIPSVVFKLCGQVFVSPTGVVLQSFARTRAPISPPALRNRYLLSEVVLLSAPFIDKDMNLNYLTVNINRPLVIKKGIVMFCFIENKNRKRFEMFAGDSWIRRPFIFL
jgi:hypothetical protein